MEAVRAAQKGLHEEIDVLTTSPATKLPTILAAALGVVIGAAVNAVVQAADGAGIGSDPVQWKRRWAEEAANIWNGAPNREHYYLHAQRVGRVPVQPQMFLQDPTHNFPESFKVHLRLHNDDVHTYDEVINALYEEHRTSGQAERLVPVQKRAIEMTNHVDTDGQVTVREYESLTDALNGYKRLKMAGLHCAVVSEVQVQMELRARQLISWLSDLCAAHPAAAAIVVHALVQVEPDHDLGGVQIWSKARSIPPWVALHETEEVNQCKLRFHSFPPHLKSSYLTHEEAETLHELSSKENAALFCQLTGTVLDFYANVPFRLTPDRYYKSPHSLWGCLPAAYADFNSHKHPFLQLLSSEHTPDRDSPNYLTEQVFVVDTDLRKQQNPEVLTSRLYPHKLHGLHMISGVGTMRVADLSSVVAPLPNSMHWRHLLGISSYRAPVSPILLLLLLDPYPTKQLRAALHILFLSLLTDSRFRSRFAGALGVAYRPLSTLFCAGVGTEADTPLHFCVQILTAGSLVRALGDKGSAELLLRSDKPGTSLPEPSVGIFVPPIAHVIVRSIQTNLLGATKEVNMIFKGTTGGTDDNSEDEMSSPGNDTLLSALTYVAGEHPLLTPLPSAPDDEFLDSRSTRHKRIPHLLRTLEYVIETPGTAVRLLQPHRYPYASLTLRGDDILSFASVFSRMLRMAQGMDTQKRKISGGHVEFEKSRWLEAFGLSLNLASARDSLAESPHSHAAGVLEINEHLSVVQEATGNFLAAILREMKYWLYRESLLETGLPVPTHQGMDLTQDTSLQRSTLHVSSSSYSEPALAVANSTDFVGDTAQPIALACATGVKMTEAQLVLIENALRVEDTLRQSEPKHSMPPGPLIGDWLRVPHSPLGGDSLSFHIPLHRSIAKCVRSMCAVAVPESYRLQHTGTWWKLPVLDEPYGGTSMESHDNFSIIPHHPLIPLFRSTLRSSNCRVTWSAGPDCSPQDAQRRRARSRAVSAHIAVAKVLHSIADHPLRCLAAAQQVERHLWARNGTSVAGMAMNYSNTPLCRSFRDLDLLLLQLSAAGFSCGLGARRVFTLMLSRFNMDGYLCDPERRASATSPLAAGGSFIPSSLTWVNPPRLQDSDHAIILAESFFATICVLATELPPPPPVSSIDDTVLLQCIRRELLHALLAEPRSHSEAMAAASIGISGDESEGHASGSDGENSFTKAFTKVLSEIGKQKNRGAVRAAAGPPVFELKHEFCDEYDPTFYHLKRHEHQHSMDVVARMRKLKSGKSESSTCLPVVAPPPSAHPRFLPCRLILHLDGMDAAIRRALLFALTNGSWLPPAEPIRLSNHDATNFFPDSPEPGHPGFDVPMTAFKRRLVQTHFSAVSFAPRDSDPTPFSKQTVAASSVSFLEVLQLLTLQIHSLEECASLHRILEDLDGESRSISAGLSINSYLDRLIKVPSSLNDVWALKPYPEGPLESKGSGEKRGSILGLLIALYEHRADHGPVADSERGDQGDEGHGGARNIASSGLKWILRFVNSLVDGAPSVSVATKAATKGLRYRRPWTAQGTTEHVVSSWTVEENVRSTVTRMLDNIPDLWPVVGDVNLSSPDKSTPKSSEAAKAAQQRQMEKIRRMQEKFAATIQPTEDKSSRQKGDPDVDLCIICRCDDVDTERNGPIGYLGHVQRSRLSQLRAQNEAERRRGMPSHLSHSYRVVGYMGCQLRETEAMDSKPLVCLPKGSVVTVVASTITKEYGVRSRRVLVRSRGKDGTRVEGWASIQSSQGYVILSPLLSLCYTNSRWGCTRPFIRQCGHAAHLRCVETHTLSLHHRAAGEQPYDGRFAANIDDGEFLCPLCKQLCNILIPRTSFSRKSPMEMEIDEQMPAPSLEQRSIRDFILLGCSVQLTSEDRTSLASKASEQFGSMLYSAMNVPWDRGSGQSPLRQPPKWSEAIQKWDFEEGNMNLLRLLRQQLISWSAVGQSAAILESSTRGVEESLPFGVFTTTTDPWSDFDLKSIDSHPSLLELKRTLAGSAGLLRILCRDVYDYCPQGDPENLTTHIGSCLADIIDGNSWILKNVPSDVAYLWSNLTAFVASIPCHVARDGTIQKRCEARATAAAMWAVKGFGKEPQNSSEVPAPLAIQKLPRQLDMKPGWGTMHSFQEISDEASLSAFRPGVACAYLYMPLLCWDLQTFAAAIFSALVACPSSNIPSSTEVLKVIRTLIIGRLIQAIVTPCGFDPPEDSPIDEEECWHGEEQQLQNTALSTLTIHCRTLARSKTTDILSSPLCDDRDSLPTASLQTIGRAILPFSRSIMLITRSCVAALRGRIKTSSKETDDDRALYAFITNADLMTVEDGFHFIKALGGPTPLQLLDVSGDWWALINRWIIAAMAIEYHHGSTGSFLLPANLRSSGFSPSMAEDTHASVKSGDSDYGDAGWQSIDRSDILSDDMDVNSIADTQQGSVVRMVDGILLRSHDRAEDSSEEELIADEDMPDAEVDDIAAQLILGAVQGQPPELGGDGDDSSDEYSSEVDGKEGDIEFAHVSKSPILYYQPSILGIHSVGTGKGGQTFDSFLHGPKVSDLSHLGLVHEKSAPSFTLIRLPKSFVELYNVVNKVKGREDGSTIDDADEVNNADTAICLLTGAIMKSGSPRRPMSRVTRRPGACTMFARRNGSGIGIFFLVQKCTVLLMHNNKSAYSPSIYVDTYGEEDPGLKRGRPLYLNEERYRALELLWRQQGIPGEVAQIRSTSDRVIRDNWY